MSCYSFQPRDRTFVKGYGFLLVKMLVKMLVKILVKMLIKI